MNEVIKRQRLLAEMWSRQRMGVIRVFPKADSVKDAAPTKS